MLFYPEDELFFIAKNKGVIWWPVIIIFCRIWFLDMMMFVLFKVPLFQGGDIILINLHVHQLLVNKKRKRTKQPLIITLKWCEIGLSNFTTVILVTQLLHWAWSLTYFWKTLNLFHSFRWGPMICLTLWPWPRSLNTQSDFFENLRYKVLKVSDWYVLFYMMQIPCDKTLTVWYFFMIACKSRGQ